MNVDEAGGRPDPIVLGQGLARRGVRDLRILAVLDLDAVLDPGEVHPPLVSSRGCLLLGSALLQSLPWHGDLDAPALIFVSRLIDRAVAEDLRLHALDVPGMDGRASIAIRLDQEKIPLRAAGIHLELVIKVGDAGRAEKDLKLF